MVESAMEEKYLPVLLNKLEPGRSAGDASAADN